MAAADLAPTNGHDLPDAEARAAAQEMACCSETPGEMVTGADLGRASARPTAGAVSRSNEPARTVSHATRQVPSGTPRFALPDDPSVVRPGRTLSETVHGRPERHLGRPPAAERLH